MQPQTRLSVAEYLAGEAKSESRHEYWDGHVVAMAGASWAHLMRVSRLIAALSNRLGGECLAVASDLRVRVSETRYVDVTVVCGEPEFSGENPPSLLNPTVLIEVLSETTERADRGSKMESYTRIRSLEEYWIVQPEDATIIRYVRRGEEWILHIEGGRDTVIHSEHLKVDIPLAEIYR